jgi:uncharacterized membrane protein YbaN (DUF454 family)
LLLSAWAAGKGWLQFEQWLLAHYQFGPPIRQWQQQGAVSRRAKWLAFGIRQLDVSFHKAGWDNDYMLKVPTVGFLSV